MPDERVIDYRRDGPVATITLDRPEWRNAYNHAMTGQVIAALREADSDDAVRAIIVTGAGDSFCVGADLAGGTSAFQKDVTTWRDGDDEVTLELYKLRKPVIAAINGVAVGIGATMTLAMDIRVASDTARFGFPFARRGIVPESCSSWFLPRLSESRAHWNG